jgi:hypothetical protein
MRTAGAAHHTGHHLQHDFASTLRWYGADCAPAFVASYVGLFSSHSDREAAAGRWVSPVNVRNDRQRSVRHASSVAGGRRAALRRQAKMRASAKKGDVSPVTATSSSLTCLLGLDNSPLSAHHRPWLGGDRVGCRTRNRGV